MKGIVWIALLSGFLRSCSGQPPPRREVYSWLTIDNTPRSPDGKIQGLPRWLEPWHIPSPVDTFIFYAHDDGILFISADAPRGNLFTRVQIHGSRWRPKPVYGQSLLFFGTYEREGLPGTYFSFYATKDRSSLMQIEYTNPSDGLLSLFFGRDSTSMRLKDSVDFDPAVENTKP